MKTNKPKRKKSRMMFLIIGITVFLAGVAGVALIATAPGRAEIAGLTFSDVAYRQLRDGIYVGAFKGTKDSSRDNRVEITVSAGELVQIEVIQGAYANGGQSKEISGGMSLDDLFASVIENRRLNVDAISGATLTSKAHLKAVEDALMKAQSE